MGVTRGAFLVGLSRGTGALGRRAAACWTLCVPAIVACDSVPTGPAPTISPTAEAHLDALLTVMEAHSVNRLVIDWPAFRSEVRLRATGAQSIVDLYPAIRLALTMLGDNHSSYRSPTGVVIFVGTRECSAASVPPGSVPSHIGYVRVRAFSGNSTSAAAFAAALHDSLRARDHQAVVGWIVDLRGNGGGNMWPMLAGVGPILGTDTVGRFVDPVGAVVVWEYRLGGAFLGGAALQPVVSPYTVFNQRPRVAVLTDNAVASSGEAIAIAFRKRATARSFGLPTCGLSTANSLFSLAGGAGLNLTVAVMGDRSGEVYGDRVTPDELIQDPSAVVQRAIAWLESGG